MSLFVGRRRKQTSRKARQREIERGENNHFAM